MQRLWDGLLTLQAMVELDMTAHEELLAAIAKVPEHGDRTFALDRVRELLPHYESLRVSDHDTRFEYSQVWRKINDRQYDHVQADDLYLASAVSKFSRAGVCREDNLELNLLRYLRGDLSKAPECDERRRVFSSKNLVDAGFAEGVGSSNGRYLYDFSLESITPEGARHLEEKERQLSIRSGADDMRPRAMSEGKSLKIFISHSSADAGVVEALIDLLRLALNLDSAEIRCTSVDGYRLPAGASTDEQLRQEVYRSTAFIGLVSDRSMASPYVVFELGARWGAGRQLVPLLISKASAAHLGGPLRGVNALSCDSASQLHQLVSELGSTLDIQPGPASSYERKIEQLIRACGGDGDK